VNPALRRWNLSFDHRGVSRTLKLALAMAAICAAWSAPAAACTVSSTTLQFGAYDTSTAVANDSTFVVSYSCAAAETPVVSISQGNALSFNRAMSGTTPLRYNLYADPARTQIFGDGTGGTVTFTGATGSSGNVTVYARIPAKQSVRSGSYSDSVVVTVTF
jgi:spore coat protein U-like protein